MPYQKGHICHAAWKAGEAVKNTSFARLTDHYKRAHGLSAAEARSRTALVKNKSCRSKSGRRLFYCPCGALVVRKTKHLTQTNAQPKLKVSVMITLAEYHIYFDINSIIILLVLIISESGKISFCITHYLSVNS